MTQAPSTPGDAMGGQLFRRDELLSGLPGRRGSTTLFAIEAETARLVAGSRRPRDVDRRRHVGGARASEGSWRSPSRSPPWALAGVIVLLVLGLINLITMGALTESVIRGGPMRYGVAYIARLASDLLGRLPAASLSVALGLFNVLTSSCTSSDSGRSSPVRPAST